MEWLPIESAPKDGTQILVTNGEWVDVGWHTRSGWLDAKYHGTGAFVIDDPREYPIAGDELGITHWMPLPEPPKE